MLMQTIVFKHVHIPAQIKMDYNVRFLFSGIPALQCNNYVKLSSLYKFGINVSPILWFCPSGFHRGVWAGEGQCGDRCAAPLTPAGDSSDLEALKEQRAP